MKRLQTSDIFAAMRIVRQADLKDALKPILKKANGAEDVDEIGIEAILTIIECASAKNAESAIYEFLSNPFEMAANEIAELPISETLTMLKELAEENDLPGFFKSLSGLMSTN